MVFNGIIEGDELLGLVPHKGKMFLLSRITYYDTEKTTLKSEFDITESCLFYKKSISGLPAWAGFELMAQSISAFSGICGREQGRGAKPGVILSITNMEISTEALKSTVKIEISEDCRVDQLWTFNSSIFSEGKKAIQAKLTVMDVDNLNMILGK
jgi:predicted hotdog family 3-hydroxylacyl-ACP dehydratase